MRSSRSRASESYWCGRRPGVCFRRSRPREFLDARRRRNRHALATVGRAVEAGRSRACSSTAVRPRPIRFRSKTVFPFPKGGPTSIGCCTVELVYSGVRRTPLCAVAPAVPFRGGWCPLAAELFATTLDVRLLCGAIPSSPRIWGPPMDGPRQSPPRGRACAPDLLRHGGMLAGRGAADRGVPCGSAGRDAGGGGTGGRGPMESLGNCHHERRRRVPD